MLKPNESVEQVDKAQEVYTEHRILDARLSSLAKISEIRAKYNFGPETTGALDKKIKELATSL